VLHVAFSDDWEACERFGEYDVATRNTLYDTAGFIHATTLQGLPAVLRDVYGDASAPLVLVVIDEDALAEASVPLTWESTVRGRAPSPRIGAPLPMDARTIAAVLEIRRDGDHWAVPDTTGLRVRDDAPDGA
jgi:uncharacterized protein (DUF952 family)